jgi:hypothetical protein
VISDWFDRPQAVFNEYRCEAGSERPGCPEKRLLLIGNLLSIPGDIALALSVVLRIRELGHGIPGLPVWPIVERRHLWKKWPLTQKSDRELKNGLENESGLSRNKAVAYRRR